MLVIQQVELVTLVQEEGVVTVVVAVVILEGRMSNKVDFGSLLPYIIRY